MTTEAARSIIDKYALHFMIALSMMLGSFVWADVKEGLDLSRRIESQQIRDGKDIERQSRDIERLRQDVDQLKYGGRGNKTNDLAVGFQDIGGSNDR